MKFINLKIDLKKYAYRKQYKSVKIHTYTQIEEYVWNIYKWLAKGKKEKEMGWKEIYNTGKILCKQVLFKCWKLKYIDLKLCT